MFVENSKLSADTGRSWRLAFSCVLGKSERYSAFLRTQCPVELASVCSVGQRQQPLVRSQTFPVARGLPRAVPGNQPGPQLWSPPVLAPPIPLASAAAYLRPRSLGQRYQLPSDIGPLESGP